MFYIGLGERQENLRGEPLAFSLIILTSLKPMQCIGLFLKMTEEKKGNIHLIPSNYHINDNCRNL
jgi:hypothetical protein